jgi:hypothetical protein
LVQAREADGNLPKVSRIIVPERTHAPRRRSQQIKQEGVN